MKKRMSRIMVLVGLVAMMTAGFAGCKKTQCHYCEEMKRCKPYNDYALGEMNLCEECTEAIAQQSKNMEEFLKSIGE